VLLPALPWLERVTAVRRAAQTGRQTQVAGDVLDAARANLLGALDSQRNALPSLLSLASTGTRSDGVSAELQLHDARSALEDLLHGPLTRLARSAASDTLGRLALSTMQLQGALENVLRAAEQLTETRLTEDGDDTSASMPAEAALRQMHALLNEGILQLQAQLRHDVTADADDARAREIEMNRLEALTRRDMLSRLRRGSRDEACLPVLALSDAYEIAGNQLYRMAEVLEQHDTLVLDHALDSDRDPKEQSSAGALRARGA